MIPIGEDVLKRLQKNIALSASKKVVVVLYIRVKIVSSVLNMIL